MPTSETYTYDPTNDSVLVDQAEQRDAENLEIGEKMVAEQEQLLAGKYKTTEDLESAYLELQKKQGQPRACLLSLNAPRVLQSTHEGLLCKEYDQPL